MVIKEEQLNNIKQKPGEKIEKEIKIELPEDIKETAEKTLKQIDAEAKNIKEWNEELLQSEIPEKEKTGVLKIQDTISKLTQKTKEKIKSIIKPETTQEAEIKQELPKIGEPMKGVITEAPNAEMPGAEAVDKDQEITWDNLVFIRATDHLPKINKDGNLILETPYSGTKEKNVDEIDPRMTVSWSINHHIRSHGDWKREKLPYIIISPAKELVENNGKPDNFADVDSYWIGDMKLPKNTIILSNPKEKNNISQNISDKAYIKKFNLKEKPERITADTLEKLGYTPIKGGKGYSRTSGISEVFNSFAKKENIESGIHRKSDADVFEDRFDKLKSHDIEHVFYTAKEFIESDPKKFINEDARKLVFKKIDQLANMGEEEMKKYLREDGPSLDKIKKVFVVLKRMIRKIK